MLSRAHVLELWQKAAMRPTAQAMLEHMAVRVVSYRTNYYDPVEKATGIPWYMVGAFDMREENFNHNAFLGNGDPLWKKSVHVPAGHGPFKTWYAGAIDALHYDKVTPAFGLGTHWDIVTVLIACEKYNGLGYEREAENSPYDWAGTNQEQFGKFTADGKFDAHAWDTQPGCAGLFLALKKNHGVDLNEA